MEILALYLILAAIVGVIAGSWGRSGFLWFLLSTVLSPLLGLIFLLVAGRTSSANTATTSDDSGARVRCDQCYELILPQAKVCKHCGTQRSQTQLTVEPLCNPSRTAAAEGFGYQMGRLSRKPLTWVILAAIAGYFIVSQQGGMLTYF